nr:hypothetical protein [Sphingobium sp. CAP-1]
MKQFGDRVKDGPSPARLTAQSRRRANERPLHHRFFGHQGLSHRDGRDFREYRQCQHRRLRPAHGDDDRIGRVQRHDGDL